VLCGDATGKKTTEALEKFRVTGGLVVMEGDGRVDQGGAAGGDVGGDDGGDEEKRGDDAEGCGVDGIDLIEGGVHGAAYEVGTKKADGKPDGGEDQGFAENHAQDFSLRRAESHAQTNFVSALCDGEGDDAIDANGGQEQSDTRKAGKEDGGETIVGEGFVDELVHGANLVDGKFGIDGLDDVGDAAGDGTGLAAGADSDARPRCGTLREGDDNFGLLFIAQIACAGVAVDANNIPRGLGGGDRRRTLTELLDGNALGERFEIGKILSREEFVDQGNGESGGGVLLAESVALDDLNAEGAEEIRSGDGEGNIWTRGRITSGLAGDLELKRVTGTDDRPASGSSGGGNAGECGDSVEEVVVEDRDLGGIGKTIGADRENHGEDVILAEAEVDAREFVEAVDDQAGSGEKREGESEFENDEETAQAVTSRADRGAAAVFQSVVEIGARRLPGRDSAAEQARDEGGGNGEKEDGDVQRDFGLGGDGEGWKQG